MASTQYLEYAGAVVSALPITMAGWARPSGTGSRTICSLYTNASNDHKLVLSVYGTHTPFITSKDTGAGTFDQAASAITDGQWGHVAAVFTSTTSRTCYLNGVAGTTGTTSSSPSGWGLTSIGRQQNSGGTQYYSGDIAEVALWNIALTTADLAQLAAAYSPLFVRPDALVAYWPLMGRDSPCSELIARFEMVVTGATAANHPRVLRPRPARAQFWGDAAVTTGAYRLVGRPARLAGLGGLAG